MAEEKGKTIEKDLGTQPTLDKKDELAEEDFEKVAGGTTAGTATHYGLCVTIHPC